MIDIHHVVLIVIHHIIDKINNITYKQYTVSTRHDGMAGKLALMSCPHKTNSIKASKTNSPTLAHFHLECLCQNQRSSRPPDSTRAETRGDQNTGCLAR